MSTLKKCGLYISCALLLSSCEFKCSVGGGSSDKKDSSKTVSSTIIEKDGTVLTNNISLTATGIKVTKATLLLQDGSRVADDNVVNLEEKIKLALYMGDGWKLRDGKAFLGASEKITTESGETIVNAEDLFSTVTDGLDPEDAKNIKLSASISKDSGISKYYNVHFRVWDKVGTAEITGDYKFYIKH